MILQDFIVKLLKLKDPTIEKEYNVILVVVDKYTKLGYFIVYIEGITAEELVEIYTKEVFIRHRAPKKIILDRDLKFVLEFQEAFIAV